MNNLRQLCGAFVLIFVLATAALADGPVNCPGILQPPPQATVEGEIPNNVTVTALQPTVADFLISLIVSFLP